MIKKLFFQFANYTSPANYLHQYDNEKCEQENAAIQTIIHSVIPNTFAITDIGCGTGLGRTLFPDYPYVGLDSSAAAIEHCRSQYEGNFIHTNANDFIKKIDHLNPVFLFSLDYLKIATISRFLNKTDGFFIAIRYNCPFLSKTSIYANRRHMFYLLHSKRKRKQLDALLKEHGAIEFPLLNEPFYTVTIVDKRANTGIVKRFGVSGDG